MDLRAFQAERGLSLSALARLLDRPVSTVHGWVNGTRRPDWAGLADIAKATGGAVTANDFQAAGSRPPGMAEAQAPFAEANALGLDADAIAEKALREAIRAEKARRWQEENRDAIEAWNRWTEENALPLAEYRMF
jgi:antitoxin CcdA